jgi:hypothetical protein
VADLVGCRLAGPGDVAIDLPLVAPRLRPTVSMKYRIARSRSQPLAWMPVSTTSRAERNRKLWIMPIRLSGSAR